MANDVTTVYVPGKVYWAKVIGNPVMNYEGDGKEWTVDFMPDETDWLKDARLLDRLKEGNDKNKIPGDYVSLRQKETTLDGKVMEAPRILDEDNEPWDGRLLGNGTEVVMKLGIKDYGKGKKKGIYINAIRVEDLVEYKVDAFAAYDNQKGEPKAKKPQTKRPAEELDDDLDSDIPF